MMGRVENFVFGNIMVEIFLCHRYPFTYFASMIGYSIGTRADQDRTNAVGKAVDEGVSIEFIDNDFKNPNHEIVIEKAKEYDAGYAVCPDIFDKSDLKRVLDTAHQLDRNGTTPIIVPKTEFDKSNLKDDWILGFSVSSDYGGTDVSYDFFRGYKTHLLGGNIKNQEIAYDMLTRKEVDVISLDSNYFFNSAGFGNIINHANKIFQGGNYNENDIEWVDSWEGRALVSMIRYYEFWQKKTQRDIHDGSVFDY